MKQTPLKHYRPPKYPELNRENEESVRLLLKRQMPARWKRLTASAAMLCAAAGVVDGCAQNAEERVEWADETPRKGGVGMKKNTVTVAPLSPEIFKHARGSFGCIAVTLPVYLSEAEAAAIIFEELEKHGIRLQPKLELKRNAPPKRQSEITLFAGAEKEQAFADSSKQREPLTVELDWFDPERGVAVEFMSVRDELFWQIVGQLRKDSSKAPGIDFSEWHNYGISAPAFAEVVPEFEGERAWKVGLFTPSFLSLTKEEDEELLSIFKEIFGKAIIEEMNAEPGRKQEGNKSDEEDLNKQFLSKKRAYLKKIGKDGEPLLRAQVKHFVKWLEEQEK